MPLSIPKPVLSGLISLCVLVGALVLSAPALATRGHVFNFSFGGKGAAQGQLSEPAGVAVNEATGDVYVVDHGNNRVEYFTSAGVFAGEFNGSGTNLAVEGKAAPTGQFAEPEAIAIDNDPASPSYGDVYVADVGHDVIDKFGAGGEYVGQLSEAPPGSNFGEIVGIAVDANGLLWVEQSSQQVDSFSAAVANEFLASREAQVFAGGDRGLAVDANDDLYVKAFFYGVVKLNSAGQQLIQEFDNLLENPDSTIAPGHMAVDLAGNEVYVVDADNEGSVGRFTTADAFVEKFGGGHVNAGSGIAVNSQTGVVYVADESSDNVAAFALEPEARPTIEEEGASAVTGSSATLNAQIKPTGPDTTYYFQYGTAECAAGPADCTDVPAAPGVEIGGGFTPDSLSVHLQGLATSTAYRFRVIAVNALGTSEATEQSFTTQTVGGEFALPDGRMWEMVTPPEKHGADLIAVGNEQGADIQAAETGGAITYGATSSFVASPAGGRAPEVTQVFSSRGAPGVWATADITTAHTEGAAGLAVGSAAEYKLFSTDLSAGLVEPTGDTPLPPLPPGSEKTDYLRMANGEYRALITSANVPPGTKFGGEDIGSEVTFIGGSRDLSHIVLGSSLQLTSTPVGEGPHLYEWAAGQLQLVSVLPDEEAVTASLGDRGDRTNGNVRNAISADGSQLVFEAGGHYYLRNVARKKTIQVDAAQGAPEPTGSSSEYQTANSEDSRVFFTSSEQLTANSTALAEGAADLYEFETTSGEPLVGKLVDLSIDGHAGEEADVRGVIGASEDGSEVYFVANGVLGDGAEHGAKPGDCERAHEKPKESCTLYAEHYETDKKAWSAPAYVATLSGADAPSWGAHSSNLKQLTARVSPNGRYLAFMSERSLTGYENRDAGSGVPDEEVYLYDASAGRLVCASCDPTGARPAGLREGTTYESNLVDYAQDWQGRWLAANIPGWTTKDLSSAIYQSRYLSNSGRLFFNSADALVPADVNGNEDVYEYEPEGIGSCQGEGHGQSASDVFEAAIGGCVGLISSGTSSEESAFMDASESGADVFFITGERLAPADVDTSLDLYDAHECSAATPCAPPASAASLPCTTGDACKAASTPQPALFGAPSSETFSGAGNIASAAPAKSAVAPKSVSKAQRLATALKACRRQSKRRRTTCERKARKRFGAGKLGKSRRARVGRRSSTGSRR